jgi:hypothetical protein
MRLKGLGYWKEIQWPYRESNPRSTACSIVSIIYTTVCPIVDSILHLYWNVILCLCNRHNNIESQIRQRLKITKISLLYLTARLHCQVTQQSISMMNVFGKQTQLLFKYTQPSKDSSNLFLRTLLRKWSCHVTNNKHANFVNRQETSRFSWSNALKPMLEQVYIQFCSLVENTAECGLERARQVSINSGYLHLHGLLLSWSYFTFYRFAAEMLKQKLGKTKDTLKGFYFSSRSFVTAGWLF